MKIRHQELEIDREIPFKTCKLDRQKYAEILTNIVTTYADGFVLAINNEWGTGKTTFVKMWQQHLQNNNFKAVYFNAWENDFDANPLVAIMAELRTLIGASNKTAFKSALQKGAVLSKTVLPGVLKAATKRYFDTQEVIDAVANATKATTEILQAAIDEYTKKKESISDFRSKLQTFVEKTDNEKPIVFIVDELDRCRPDYAVEVLEQMKHFFSVPGIVFVLSIDKQHLAASVRGFYGSEQINADEYLRRFIDLEYSIPEPSTEQFCKYLYNYYEFDNFFKSVERSKHSELQSDPGNLLTIARLLFAASRCTLRQMEKIFGQTRLILNSFKANQYTLCEALCVLVFLAVLKPEIYLKIKRRQITVQELSDLFCSLFPAGGREVRFLIHVAARLLVLYDNQNGSRRASLIVESNEGEVTTDIKLNLGDEKDGDNLAKAIKYIYNGWDTSDTEMNFLTNKIDLTEPLVFQ